MSTGASRSVRSLSGDAKAEGCGPPQTMIEPKSIVGKLMLFRGLFGAAVPVAVALIGLLPEYWKLKAQVEEMRRQNGYLVDGTRRQSISGTIRQASPGPAPSQYEVYLVPGNNYMASPGADGRFRFESLFPGSYAIIVRELSAGASPNGTIRALITPGDREERLELGGVTLDYRVEAEAEPSRRATP